MSFTNLVLMFVVAVVVTCGLLVPLVPLVDCGLFRTDPDIGIKFEDLVQSRGFVVETHQIVTEDYYILTVQRIVNPAVHDLSQLVPVLLQHGQLDTGMDFVINSPYLYSKQSSAPYATVFDPNVDDYLGDNLGFDLALTRRYDVWIANSRGVLRTKEPQHLNFSTNDPQFWAFGVDELGRYDLPAVIDFVLAQTNRSTLGFVGFSQGTTSLFVLLTMRPEYGDRIEPAIAMAPVTFRSHQSSPLRRINPEFSGVCAYDGQLIHSRQVINGFMSRYCPFDLTGLICPQILRLFGGLDFNHFNRSRVPVYYSHVPAPGSNRIQCHNHQNYKTGRFARFNYGSTELNRAHYGSSMRSMSIVPEYPLERVRNLTIAFFMGQRDQFATFGDLHTLIERLSISQANLLPVFTVKDPNWAHLNFVYGTNAGNLVYRHVIDILDRYSHRH